jgi:hypothetical protein
MRHYLCDRLKAGTNGEDHKKHTPVYPVIICKEELL